ncbi:MAG: dTDP-4-dehydrorhamnose reductase [Cellulomonas sp.]
MRWLVTGAGGMLGQDVVARLTAGGEKVTALHRSRLDITNPAAVEGAVRGHDVVVNCAAWTGVDAAEAHEGEAFAVNALGAALIARAARRAGARTIQISTDYVFDGTARKPYPEMDPLAPRSAYGRTKAAGEWAVRAETDDYLIVRTAWLYGAAGPCFPKTIARAGAIRGALDVVDDQMGQPTWTADLADLLVRLVHAGAVSGTYHGTASGQTSWHDFARTIVEAAGMDPAMVAPTSSATLLRPAPRPAYSVLGHATLDSVGVEPIGAWAQRWAAAAPSVLAG